MTLDPAALAGHLHNAADRRQRSRQLIERWLDAHHGHGWVAWSGGKDSTATADLVHTVAPELPIVHFDCGLDFPENTAYMADVAAARNWNYQIIRVGDGLAAMAANGSWDHSGEADGAAASFWWVSTNGPYLEARERFGDLLIWGLRADESVGRRWNLAPRSGLRDRADGSTTASPIWWWSRRDTFAHLHARGIAPNPIYGHLANLGVPEVDRRVDVAVGSDGQDRGRLVWLRRGWPDLHARIAEVLPRLREKS